MTRSRGEEETNSISIVRLSGSSTFDIDTLHQSMYLTHQLEGEHGLVSVGEVGVHGHDDAVGDDGQDDAVLEGAAVDEPLHQPPDGVGGFEDEQAANKH